MPMIKKMINYFTNNNLSPKNNRKKVGIILFTTSIGLFFLFVSRLTYIVVVGDIAGTSLEEKTQALYEGKRVVKAKRGTIYDRNGVAIAEDATSYSAYAILTKSYMQGDKELYAQEKDFEKIATILTNVLGERVKKETILKVLREGVEKEKWQVDIPNSKSLTLQEKEAIEEALAKEKILGIHFEEHPSRIYPNGMFSSHLIGYADIQVVDNQEALQGGMGIEAAYDDLLKGKDGEIIFQKDNFQNPLPGTVAESIPAEDGQDIQTTLDSRIQSYLETLMDEAWEKSDSEYLTAVLVESKTNEIISLAQRPSFNPEKKEEGFSKEGFLWQNLFVEETFEPGSTMKTMTVASAMDQGIFDPNERFTPGKMDLIDAEIRDWDIHIGAKPSLTMRQALSWSSNVGMVKLEQRMPERWEQYLKEFGFGQSTQSKLFGEAKGLLPEDNIVSKAMSSFGQGIAVTQLQMLQAFSAIANDGEMLKPSYIKKFIHADGSEEVVTPEVVGHPVTATSAQTVRQYMRDVVEDPEYGTAYQLYEVDDYAIAAKTGTAQVAEGGVYLEGDNTNLYSVVVMLPAEDPQYTLYLTMKKPKKYSSDILPGIANPLLQRAMDLREVDGIDAQDLANDADLVADYRNLETTLAVADSEEKELSPVVIGDGEKVVAQSIPSNTAVLPGEKLILLTDGQTRTMPDTTGWSKADLIRLGNLLSVEVTFSGEGYGAEQSIAPEEQISGKKIHFTLKKEN
ncbi:penicillin-binding transpeptidase domain-containing protein [Enterococcus sp. LJL98]